MDALELAGLLTLIYLFTVDMLCEGIVLLASFGPLRLCKDHCLGAEELDGVNINSVLFR